MCVKVDMDKFPTLSFDSMWYCCWLRAMVKTEKTEILIIMCNKQADFGDSGIMSVLNPLLVVIVNTHQQPKRF